MNTIILSLRGSKKAARVSLTRAVKDLLNAARLTGRMSGEGRFLPSSILFSKLFHYKGFEAAMQRLAEAWRGFL